MDDADGCEIVQQWNRDLAPSEVYRRHEARDAGIGVGWLQDMPVYVLLVGVPPTPNPSRRRELGTAPREYPIADLLRLVNRRRGAVGLPELGRDPQLDAAAQGEAFRILSESAPGDETLGYRTEGGVTFVYARVANDLARDFRPSVDRWFQLYRDELLRRDRTACGAGIASREAGERLEAVLVLALSAR